MKSRTFKVLGGDFPKETRYTYLLGSQYFTYSIVDDMNDRINRVLPLSTSIDSVWPLKDKETVYGAVASDEMVITIHFMDGRKAIVLVDLDIYYKIKELTSQIAYNIDYAGTFEMVSGGSALLSFKNSL